MDQLEALPVGTEAASSHMRYTDEQTEYLQQLELKRRGAQLAIPTSDEAVRGWLRALREPITRFGEGPYDRRERLRKLLATNPSYLRTIRALISSSREEEEAPSGAAKDDEEFFVPGDEELETWRRWLVQYSIPRARRRLAREQTYRQQPSHIVKEHRETLWRRSMQSRLEASQVGGERPLSSCAFSMDGSLIATGDFGGTCRLWNREDCSLLRELGGVHTSRIGNVAFNPAETSRLALASSDNEGKIGLWELAQVEAIGTLQGHTARVPSISFHPSGRLLGSASFDYSWRLWDLERAACIQLQEGHSRPVYSLAFHSDGSLAATGALDSHARLWDLRSGRAIWTLQGHHKTILSLAFHPMRPLLATASEDGTVRIWDFRALRPLLMIPAHSAPVSGVVWDGVRPDHGEGSGAGAGGGERLVTVGYEGLVRVWGAADGRPLASLIGHEGRVMAVDWRDDLVVSASADRTFKLWRS